MPHESQTIYRNGSRLAIDNANALFKIGNAAASQEEYGIGCALNILAAEEAVKAIVLFSRYYYYNPDKNGRDKYLETITKSVFSNHKHKHKLLRRIILGINTQGQTLSEMFEFMINLMASAKSRFPHIAETFDQALPEIKRHQGMIEQYVHLKFDIEALFSWLDHANHEKNSGLYVGWENEAWNDPRAGAKFTLAKYENDSEISKSVIDFASNIEQFTSVYEQFTVESLALLIYNFFSQVQPIGGNDVKTTPMLKEYFDMIKRIDKLRKDADSLLTNRGEDPIYHSDEPRGH